MQGHSLPGHTPVRYTFALDGPRQKVIKMRKLPPFSLPPREVEETQEISDRLLKHWETKWAALISEGNVNTIWDQWTWLAEEVGLALSCNHLTKDSPGATLPFAPKSAPRGRGTAQMLRETTLAPSKTTAYGGPRTRLISKITGALGSLRTVIQWQRKEAGVQGNRLTASARRKAQRAVRLGAVPMQVQHAWQAACRRMRKVGAAIRDDLLL